MLPPRLHSPLVRKLSSCITSLHIGVAQSALALVGTVRSSGCLFTASNAASTACLLQALQASSRHWCPAVADLAGCQARSLNELLCPVAVALAP